MDITRLKDKRTTLGLSQTDVAIQLGLTKSSYSKRENSKLDFSISELQDLVSILKLSNKEITKIFFNHKVALK